MADWFNSLSILLQILWGMAFISTIALVVILIITFSVGGADAEMDIDAEVEADTGIGFQFFTIKGMVAFFCIFSWVAIFLETEGVTLEINLIISIIAGLLMMLAMAMLFYYVSKLVSSGTLDYENAIDQIGEVYLTVGANRKNIGKVQIRVQGALRDMDALTDHNEDLKQGSVVVVEKTTSNGILIIKPKS